MTDELSDDKAVALFRTLRRKHAMTVLRAAAEPVTIRQLTDEYGVPRTTCYKRLNELMEAGLLTAHGTRLSPTGNHKETYLRRVDHLEISFDESVTAEIATGESDRTEIVGSVQRSSSD